MSRARLAPDAPASREPRVGPRELATAGALGAFLVVGFLGGRMTSPVRGGEATPVVASTRAVATVSRGEAFSDDARNRAVAIGGDAALRDGCDHEHSAPGDLSGEVVDAAPGTPLDLGPLLAAGRAARATENEESLHAADLAAAALAARLMADPAALAEALEAFGRLEDRFELLDLAAVLARVADPEVEAAALAMAAADPSPARRAAAFDILDALDSPETRAIAVETLGREADVDVRRAALRAMPEPDGTDWSEAGEVSTALAGVLRSDQDEESARRAAVLIGRWRRDAADLDPVIGALASDPRPGVRAGAAFALEVAGDRSRRVVDRLVASLASDDEDPLVRENAWRALGALSPLPDEARRAWRDYADGRESEGEALELEVD